MSAKKTLSECGRELGKRGAEVRWGKSVPTPVLAGAIIGAVGGPAGMVLGAVIGSAFTVSKEDMANNPYANLGYANGKLGKIIDEVALENKDKFEKVFEGASVQFDSTFVTVKYPTFSFEFDMNRPFSAFSQRFSEVVPASKVEWAEEVERKAALVFKGIKEKVRQRALEEL